MPAPQDDQLVYAVDTQTFEDRVIAASRQRPVVVDFWAEWCGPCRALGPALEEAVRAQGGRAALAKVNVDQNPDLAAAFGIRGIPAVKVFKDGRVAVEFVGALPREEIERVLAKVIPSVTDETAKEGLRLLEVGHTAEAEARFREVLAADERHPVASAGLARIALERGDLDEARRLAEAVEPGTPAEEQAAAALARIDFIDHCRRAGGLEAALDRSRQNEQDLDARYDLALCRAAQGDYRAALDDLLAVIAADRHFRDDAAKEACVRIFSIVGQRSDLADAYRARLAQLLY